MILCANENLQRITFQLSWNSQVPGNFPGMPEALVPHSPQFIPLRYSNSSSSREASLRYLDRLQPFALLVMRVALGIIMIAHGSHKVFGGLHHFSQAVSGMGFPAWMAYVAAFTELLGGLLVLAGLFTRAAAFAICIDLVVAIWKVHLHNGLIGTPDHPGFEFPLAAAALAFALIFFGGGSIAIDHMLRGGGTTARSR